MDLVTTSSPSADFTKCHTFYPTNMSTPHTGESIRSEAIARRKVYKNVIDSPFAVKWYEISRVSIQPMLIALF